MEEEVTAVDEALGTALDFDVLRDGAWVGVFQLGSAMQVATSFGQRFPLPRSVRHPIVRFIDRERLVLVDSRTQGKTPSGFIFGTDGSPIQRFQAGEGIEDVIVLKDVIAITYFDQGVFSGIAPSEQGVAFFDHYGRYFSGYKTLFARADAADIVDCYAACRVDHHTLAFSSYTKFPLVHANPMGVRHHAYSLPEELHGASAISVRNDTALVFDPYAKKGTILSWREGMKPQEVGRHPGPLRGLESGRFLSSGRHGFTVLLYDVR